MVRNTRTRQVMAAIQRQIASRALVAGEKLPSVRQCAGKMGVSPATVVDAYDRLVADGLIYARRGAGFFVAPAAQPFVVTAAGPHLERAIDPFWVSRQSLDAGPDMLKPGCGWLPADWMPQDALRRAIRGARHADDHVLADYGDARGGADLRRLLARQCADEGLDVGPDQILLTCSGTQSIDLICRLLLQPGDCVLVDDPCYFNFTALLRAHRVRVESVARMPDGPDPDVFARRLRAHRPRLYITNSAIHNPTGGGMSPPVAHKILTMAAAQDLVIVEDDIFAAFAPEMSPRLAVFDGLEHVIRIGSFSKTLSAAVRCGYIVARPDWIEALVDLQVATNFGGPGPLAVSLIHAMLHDGRYRKHLERLRLRLAQCRRDVAAHLTALGITPWLMPKGGFYLWCRLPDGLDSADLARAALAQNMVLAPGNVFSIAQNCGAFMRFNVSQTDHPKVYDFLAQQVADAGARSG